MKQLEKLAGSGTYINLTEAAAAKASGALLAV